MPELVLFGSSGGGEAYGFRRDDKSVVSVPFIPLEPESILPLAASFTEFVGMLERGEVV